MYCAIRAFLWTSQMLSILGRIGHVLRRSEFYVDQLDIIYTGPDRLFIEPSGRLCGPVRCYLYWA